MWRETEKKERQEERAGNREPGGSDREQAWKPQTFGEGRRLKIQQSTAHCPALSSNLAAVMHGGRGEGGGNTDWGARRCDAS